MPNFTDTAAVVTITTLNSSNVAADVTTLTAYTRSPKNVETVYEYGTSGTWTHPATGDYTFTFTPTTPGTWRLGFVGVHSSFTAMSTTQVEITTLRPFD